MADPLGRPRARQSAPDLPSSRTNEILPSVAESLSLFEMHQLDSDGNTEEMGRFLLQRESAGGWYILSPYPTLLWWEKYALLRGEQEEKQLAWQMNRERFFPTGAHWGRAGSSPCPSHSTEGNQQGNTDIMSVSLSH